MDNSDHFLRRQPHKVKDINKIMGAKRSLFDALLGKEVKYEEGPYEGHDLDSEEIEEAEWRQAA